MAAPQRYLNWILRDNNNCYYRLNDVNLKHRRFDGLTGVYIVFYQELGGRRVYIYAGRGVIKDRIRKHRKKIESSSMSYTTTELYILQGRSSFEEGQKENRELSPLST